MFTSAKTSRVSLMTFSKKGFVQRTPAATISQELKTHIFENAEDVRFFT